MTTSISTSPTASENEPDSWIYVCRTCKRNAPLAPDEVSKGKRIASRLPPLLHEANLQNRYYLRVVNCLGGCVNPCNIAFRGKGKCSYRFGGLEPGDEAAIMVFADAYARTPYGLVPPEMMGEGLRTKLTSKIIPANVKQASETEA